MSLSGLALFSRKSEPSGLMMVRDKGGVRGLESPLLTRIALTLDLINKFSL
jgi:hypothetical protein